MGNILTASQLVEDTSIAARAMKVVLNRGLGAARRTRDAAAERLVKDQLGDQGQIVTRKLFANKGGLINRRNTVANEMYAYHMQVTLPHGDDGSRLLPNGLYFDYTTQMGMFERRLAEMDAEIINTYPQLVAADVAERNAALISQGKTPTADPADYPSPMQMQRYLYVHWHVEPISTAHDFRFEVGQDVVERLNGRLEQMKAEADADLLLRLMEPMKRFVDKLSVPIGEQGAIFRDSLVGNLNELVQLLPKLNINDDPRVTEMVDGINAIIKPYVFQPNALRDQPEARQSAKDKMAELMKRFEGYGIGG